MEELHMEAVKYPVLIMAGGPTPDSILETGEPEPERAFIDIGGRPMLDWVLDACRGSNICGHILCVGNASRLQETFGLRPEETIEQKKTMLENFIAGIEILKNNDRVMIMTCDIPLISSEAIDDLGRMVGEISADIYYPIIDVRLFDDKFPGGKRTVQKLKEGTFTGGNVFIVEPNEVLANRDKVEAVIRDRKNPAKLVKLFGFVFIVKFLMRKLDLPGLEAKASQILGSKMRGLITPYPEIGFDVDKPEDLEMIRGIMGHG